MHVERELCFSDKPYRNKDYKENLCCFLKLGDMLLKIVFIILYRDHVVH